MASERPKKITFTKHARDKLKFLGEYGFTISETSVREAVGKPSRIDRRNDQIMALKPLDREYALRVVYKIVNEEGAVQCIGSDTTQSQTC